MSNAAVNALGPHTEQRAGGSDVRKVNQPGMPTFIRRTNACWCCYRCAQAALLAVVPRFVVLRCTGAALPCSMHAFCMLIFCHHATRLVFVVCARTPPLLLLISLFISMVVVLVVVWYLQRTRLVWWHRCDVCRMRGMEQGMNTTSIRTQCPCRRMGGPQPNGAHTLLHTASALVQRLSYYIYDSIYDDMSVVTLYAATFE